ncbi:YdcF family protein [Candidatus Pacearchaeota archaeon]|nr:YdcF family protein [Candidatus Pacearchaeota archaeon]
MEKTYDVLLLPTGEPMNGNGAVFPVSREAVNIYNSGKIGCIYVTGGHGGFSIVTGETRSEAEYTRDFLLERGIPEGRVYWDEQSLDTMGNFTFPMIKPVEGNPNLLDFNSMLVLGQEGHMWRASDYASLVLPKDKMPEIQTVPGKHNDGLIAKVYHNAFMHALKCLKDSSAEGVHDFLINRHPFYSKDWFEKSPSRRKIKMAKVGLGWYLKK